MPKRNQNLPSSLYPRDEDIKLLLAAKVHLGTRNIEPQMERYVWKTRPDGVNIINLAKTWEKLVLAARIIVAIENPSDVCVISGPQNGQRAVLKFANFTGSHAIAGRFTPGTFTNQIQDKFLEPRLLVATDPRSDRQAIRESSYGNVPTIAFANVDSPVQHVDVVIPCNNKSTQAVGLMWWLLAREVLRLRGTLSRTQPWDVMVDLFFYRSPEEKADETQNPGNNAVGFGQGPIQESFRLAESSGPGLYDQVYQQQQPPIGGGNNNAPQSGNWGTGADAGAWDAVANATQGGPDQWTGAQGWDQQSGNAAPPPTASWDQPILQTGWDQQQR